MVSLSLVPTSAVRMEDGVARVSSVDLARDFGKRHADVLRQADKILELHPELAERNFASSSYRDENNRESRCLSLDRKGFMALALGFTGDKAIHVRLAYIDLFDEYERRTLSVPVKSDLTRQEFVDALNATLAPRLDNHDNAIARVETEVGEVRIAVRGLEKKVEDLDQYRPRKYPNRSTMRHLDSTVDRAYGGRCPCGCGNMLGEDRQYDHFNGRHRNSERDMWPLNPECHKERHIGIRDMHAQFKAFQEARSRLWDQEQLTFFR